MSLSSRFHVQFQYLQFQGASEKRVSNANSKKRTEKNKGKTGFLTGNLKPRNHFGKNVNVNFIFIFLLNVVAESPTNGLNHSP